MVLRPVELATTAGSAVTVIIPQRAVIGLGLKSVYALVELQACNGHVFAPIGIGSVFRQDLGHIV